MVSYLNINQGKEDASETKDKKSKAKTNSFWSFLTKKYRGRVRSACLRFVSEFLKQAPTEIAE